MWKMKNLFFSLIFLGICELIRSKELVEHFNISNDGSRITWAHAVNSRSQLKEALESDVMMLETDISMGTVSTKLDSTVIEPIMAHPPLNSSDISLNDWLDTVINSTNVIKKGIKLDFKFDEALESSFKIIQNKTKINEADFPLIINADILAGPVDPTAKPVNSTLFLKLCQQYFPSSIISPGWTTSMAANDSMSHLNAYSWLHVFEMVRALRKHNITQKVTFPVRAPFLVNSMDTLTWLSDVVPNSSFTVWTGAFDSLNIEELIDFRQMLPQHSVYFDLPNESDLEILRSSEAIAHRPSSSSQCKNVLQSPYFWSNSCAISGSTAIVMPESCIITFNFPLSEIAKQDGFLLKGVIELFPNFKPINSSDSALILSFGQQASKLFLFSNGFVRLFTEKFGWHIVKEKGNTFGFEISIPNAEDSNNLETVVRIYPLNERDFTVGHDRSGFHRYILERSKGDNVFFQFITHGNKAVALTNLETLCIQTPNAAFNRYFNVHVFWIAIVGAIYCQSFNWFL